MMADFDPKLAYEVFRDLLIFLFFVWTAVTRSRSVNRAEIDEVRKNHTERLDRHSEKLTQFDERMKAMPKHDDLENLHERINRVNENVGKVQSSVSGIKATVDAIKSAVALLNRHHLGEGK